MNTLLPMRAMWGLFARSSPPPPEIERSGLETATWEVHREMGEQEADIAPQNGTCIVSKWPRWEAEMARWETEAQLEAPCQK